MAFKQQRIFGLVISSLLTATGLWLFSKGSAFTLPCLLIASLLILLTIGAPQRLSYPTQLWEKLGHRLETINSYLILGVLFFLILTPLGVIARRFGYDPLKLRPPSATKSYWQTRRKKWESDSFKDQF